MEKLDKSALTELIMRCRAGDDDAFAALVSAYTPLITGVIERLSLSVDDCFNEACLGLYRAALSYNVEQDGVTFGLYARICITRRLYDHKRSDEAHASRMCDLDVDTIAVSDGIISRLEREEEREEFRSQARRILSDYEYRVFLLWLSGYKTAAIAELLKTDAKSVDNAKARIIRKLRDGLDVPRR